MPTKRKIDPPHSPAPGVIPEPVRVQPDAARAEPPARWDPGAERDARRHAREEARGPHPQRPEVRTPNRHRRLPLEASQLRLVAAAGIVAVAVGGAALLGSLGTPAWMLGLVVSVVSLGLAAPLWSSPRA